MARRKWTREARTPRVALPNGSVERFPFAGGSEPFHPDLEFGLLAVAHALKNTFAGNSADVTYLSADARRMLRVEHSTALRVVGGSLPPWR